MGRSKFFLWTTTILVFFSCFIFTGHGQESEDVLLTVGVLRSFPPQYSLSSQGEPQGFAVDSIEALAELSGFSLRYEILESWDDMFAALESGEIDIIPNQGITDRRKELFSFSDPVEVFPIHIFLRKESPLDIQGLGDLSGHSVAVVEKNVGEALVEGKDFDTKLYHSAEDALYSLLSGNVDAFIFPKPVLLQMARQIRIDDRIKTSGPPILEIKRAISVRKGNEWILDKFNSHIPSLIESPTYLSVYQKWYGEPTPFWTVPRVGIGMLIFIVLFIVGILIWKNLSVRRLVELRTRELNFDHQLLSQVMEAIITIDLDLGISSFNKAAEALFGYQEKEVLGQSVEMLWNNLHEEELSQLFAKGDSYSWSVILFLTKGMMPILSAPLLFPIFRIPGVKETDIS